MKIGDKIKDVRKAKNMSQKELAARTNIAISSLQLYEYHKRQPTIEQIHKIADALGVPINHLIDTPYSAKSPDTIFPLWLDALGFNLDIDTEVESCLTLMDVLGNEKHEITEAQFSLLKENIAAYTKFQVREMLKTCRSVPSNQKGGEPHA